MKKYFITLIILLFQISNGQINKVQKRELVKYFKKKNNFERQWISCNSMNEFYNSDTLYFHDGINYNQCKKYIIWGFINSKKIYQVEGENYNNYNSVKIITENDWYKIKIIEKENETLINIFKQKKLFQSFKVYELGYNQKEKSNRLLLIRNHQYKN